MIVGQRRVSKSRRDKRRSHMSLKAPTTTVCSHCSKTIRTHTVCVCGFYGNKKIF